MQQLDQNAKGGEEGASFFPAEFSFATAAAAAVGFNWPF